MVEGREVMMGGPQDWNEVDRGVILITMGEGDGGLGIVEAWCCSKSKSKSLPGDDPSCKDVGANGVRLKLFMPESS